MLGGGLPGEPEGPVPECGIVQRQDQEPVLEHGQCHQRGDERKAGAVEIAGGHDGEQEQPGHQHGRRRDHHRKQKIHRTSPHIGRQEAQVRGEPVLVNVGNTQEQIQLCAPAHRPQRDKGPGTELVRGVPGEQDDRDAKGDDRGLVMQTGLQGQPEARPTGDIGGTGELAGSGNKTHEVAHLQPGPDQQGL